ncbi:MAG: hypothetical protein DRQ42_05745 [Gammaproteobacteria bacterium]|nr:MAG: hypothetical protein DRQ42_05745 [Gammaproteobacteria bacterium]
MKAYYNIHTIWLVMMFLTLSTYALGDLGFSGVVAVLILLSTAAIKGVFIIRDFMELKGVSLLWRVIMYGWLGTVCLAIAITYFITI